MHTPGWEGLRERIARQAISSYFSNLGKRSRQVEREVLGEEGFRQAQSERGKLGNQVRWGSR